MNEIKNQIIKHFMGSRMRVIKYFEANNCKCSYNSNLYSFPPEYIEGKDSQELEIGRPIFRQPTSGPINQLIKNSQTSIKQWINKLIKKSINKTTD